ncbi:hypothetical protein BDY19DRAFT_906702 [Irpex rosettiformis]|uniref:Uncharacterized protein n=1 Tax=Irpex rosettiformis TaxID=378272 RepID=A0ACB8U3C0_9APHY|nr:hypothetical protein BDY19DRAFT_906702 [Irpex rosettiformis]
MSLIQHTMHVARRVKSFTSNRDQHHLSVEEPLSFYRVHSHSLNNSAFQPVIRPTCRDHQSTLSEYYDNSGKFRRIPFKIVPPIIPTISLIVRNAETVFTILDIDEPTIPLNCSAQFILYIPRQYDCLYGKATLRRVVEEQETQFIVEVITAFKQWRSGELLWMAVPRRRLDPLYFSPQPSHRRWFSKKTKSNNNYIVVTEAAWPAHGLINNAQPANQSIWEY